jgi:uncharacterized membrane protein
VVNDPEDKFIGLSGNGNLIVLEHLTLEWDEEIGPIVFLKSGNRRYGLCFCHRRKDRSIWFFGLEKVLCSRCLGMLFGGMAGILCVISHVRIDPAWSLLLLLPLVLDGFLQLVRDRESTNGIRLVTGFLFGVGLPLFLAVFFTVLKNQLVS